MRMPTISRLFLCFTLLLQSTASFAFETDQYNLPPVPLADIGDEVSEYAEQTLREVITQINAEIVVRQSCLETKQAKKVGCGATETERKRLEYLRSEEAVTQELYKRLGNGFFPLTKVGNWMNTHKFRAQPARYKTTYLESIFVTLPTDYLTISPTVNLYGAQFGVDKIEHFFQQGHTYYETYKLAITKGLTPDNAVKKAVKWGQKSERTFFGTLVSGVYSNADLVANYAGMKFYQGLTKPVKIGIVTRPAVLVIKDGVWTFNEKADLGQIFIKPFFTEHLNEALNPSAFVFNLLPSIRRIVKKQSCAQWLKLYPGLSKAALEATTSSLNLWNGEDYGYTPSKKFVTIANTCFADESNTDKTGKTSP